MKVIRSIFLALGYVLCAANVAVAIQPPYELKNIVAVGVAVILADSLRRRAL